MISGSSSGSSSMQHSFSVDEIQKIRTRLKASRSCGDGVGGERDDADNSSSGVSSDQEAAARPRRDKVSFCSSVTVKASDDRISTEPVHSSSESLAPLSRRYSLAGARARSAAERLGVDVRRAPGRLLRLPPPPAPAATPAPGAPAPPAPLLAPPPQFCDRARVVAALPKLA